MLLLSELIGRRVREATGEESGRLRDLAVRLNEPYPSVTRLRVGRGRRRRLVDRAQVADIGDEAIQLRAGPDGARSAF